MSDPPGTAGAILSPNDFRDVKSLSYTELAVPRRCAWNIGPVKFAGVGERKPSEEPMVVGYSPSGDVLKEVAKRSEFPDHASEIQENDRVGVTGFGHTSDSIWFWLPGSTDLVTFKTHGSSLNRSVTGLPNQSPREITVRVLRTDIGTPLTEIRSSQDEQHGGQFNFFSRSAATNQWEPFYPPRSLCTLIGTDSGQALFLKAQDGRLQIYVAPLPE